MNLVVDSSVALSWCFEDERTPATKALLNRVGEEGALAPQLWPIEALNGLIVAERRRRIDAGKRRQLADFLRDLPISLDLAPRSRSGVRARVSPNVSALPSTMPSTSN